MSDAVPVRAEARMELDYSREPFDKIPLPERVLGFPELRYMGSKHRLLTWLHGVLRSLDFETAADPFTGSGSVAYLLKAMGKQVFASDFLNFPAVFEVRSFHSTAEGIESCLRLRKAKRSRSASSNSAR